MHILSHRGLWENISEKNSIKSLRLSLHKDFGLETDLRDFHGSLVVSHDPVISEKNILFFQEFLETYKEFNNEKILALNIKSDGIICNAEDLLKKFEIKNYFYFDMSVPQLISAHKSGIKNIFCRHSEYESTDKVIDITKGVWLDSFNGEHANFKSNILHFLNRKKIVSIVSPELHGKNQSLMYNCWEKIKSLEIPEEMNQLLMLCTDLPLVARDFFKNDN